MAERNAEHPRPLAIPVNVEDLLASRMTGKLLEIELGEKIEEPQTIYIILPSIRAEDNGAYDPKIISIGNNKELLPMQQHKWQFLHDQILRSSTNSLNDYINVARSLKSRAGNCYSGQVEPEDDEFEEMLVLDGCFIIEFLVKWNLEEKVGPLNAVHWILPHLKNDLLLLKNQLPFFVLQSLFDASVIPDLDDFKLGKDTITWLYLSYFTRCEMDITSIPYNVSHLLQLFHFTLRLTVDGRDACTRAPRIIPSATDLQEAGLQFKAKEKARGFLDITFNDGALEIPMLPVQAASIPLFQNLVAFQQCSPGSGSDFTSYVALMDNLIDTSDDVLVLEGCGILESKLGGEEEVTKFFNSLRMGAYLEYDKHYLWELFT